MAVLPPAPVPKKGPPSRIGIEAAVGLGAVGFIEQGAKDMTQIGEQWDARLTFGSRSYIAVEAAYIGSVQSIDALGLSRTHGCSVTVEKVRCASTSPRRVYSRTSSAALAGRTTS